MFYAVANGINKGIFNNWNDCKKNVLDFPNAKYRKFMFEDDAINYIKDYEENKINSHFTKKINIIDKTSNDYKIHEMLHDMDGVIYVFTDGACSNNGKSNAVAGIGVYFKDNDKKNISKKITGKLTNNTAELKAVVEAFDILKNNIIAEEQIVVCTDSEYVIKCCSSFGSKLEKKNWKNDKGETPPNVELVQYLYNICKKYKNIQFKHIPAHTDNDDFFSIGNKNADLLANNAIGVKQCPYNKNNITTTHKKIYINVSFNDKDYAKSLGSKWDPDKKSWYIFDNLSKDNMDKILEKFSKK